MYFLQMHKINNKNCRKNIPKRNKKLFDKFLKFGGAKKKSPKISQQLEFILKFLKRKNQPTFRTPTFRGNTVYIFQSQN